MRVGIVGHLGVIGSACKFGFEKLGHSVVGHDVLASTSLSDLKDCEIVYVCVPTPQLTSGECDSTVVRNVVCDLVEMFTKRRGVLAEETAIIAIKSTVSPGTTADIIEKEQITYDTAVKICFVPEFLRERCAISDFVENQRLLAVGTDSQYVFEKVVSCHGTYPKQTVKLSSTQAELLKYYSNSFNALRIVFANQMYDVCKQLDVDYTQIKDAFIKISSVPDVYLDVNDNFRGYAGMCLPKDVRALSFLISNLGLDSSGGIIGAIDSANSKYDKTVFDGMRK